MDWLSSNQVILNCAKKSIIFPNFENLLKSPTNLKSEHLMNEMNEI